MRKIYSFIVGSISAGGLKSIPFFSLFMCIGFVGCIDFTTYSDSNEVVKVRAGVLSSDEVYVDKQEIISSPEGRIVLRVKGRIEENLPLTVDAEFELSSEASILYSEKYKQFVFRSVTDSFSFQVIAQSGLPRKWTVSLKDARSADGDVLAFRVKSYQAAADIKGLVAEDARLYKMKDTSLVEIFVNAASDTIFPLKVTPEIQISENGYFVDYKGGQALTFEGLHTVYNLRLEAENKSVKHWRVTLRTPDSDDANLKGGEFIVFSDCLEVNNMAFRVDTANADALVNVAVVKDWKNFSALLQYEMKLPLGAKMIILDGQGEDFDATKAIFNRIEDIRKFKIVSQSGKEKIWKIKLGYNYNNQARVENISLTSSRPENVNISLPLSAIDTAQSKIYIHVNSGVKNITAATPLYIFPVLKLSAKASMDAGVAEQGDIYRLPEIAFTSMNAAYRFKILSESRKEYTWTIVLVDKQKDKDTEAEIKNVVIHSDKLPSNVSFSDNIYTADKDKREVILKLQTVKFPFLMAAGAYTVNVSDKAVILDKGQDLVFEDINDRKTIRVEAENGAEKVWSLRLNYTWSIGADIKSLKINKVFPDVQFDKVAVVNAETAEITVNVTDAAGSFPVRMDVEALLSDNARLEPELKSIVFAGENSVVKANVIAESGAAREWTVRLKNQVVKSDKASVEKFQAESVIPEITIGAPSMQGTTISVPVLSGRKQFPLTLDVNKTVLSEGAKTDKMILTFENIGRTEVFNVTSQSGKVSARYTVVLVDQMPLSNAADIISVKLERYQPLDYKLSGGGESVDGKALIEVYGDLDKPLVVWPVLTLSEGAKLEKALPGTGYEFRSLADLAGGVVVVAENGSRKTWAIGLKKLDAPKNTEAIIEQVEASNTDHILIEPMIKDNSNVVFYLANAQPRYPFTVEATLSVSPNSKVEVVSQVASVSRMMRNTRAGGAQVVQVVKLTFDSASDQLTVKVTSEDGSVKNDYKFSLGGVKVKSTEANVQEYKIESYFPMNMSEAPVIFEPDTVKGVITVNAPDENAFPFTIYTKMKLSYKAELKGLDASKMTFERGFSGQDFEVTSESGKVKKWRLVMKVAEKSKENNVTSFDIKEYSPLASGLGKPEIRVAERKIIIPVKDWIKNEHLTLSGQIGISLKAATDFRTSLFFQSAKDEYSFNVTAQNGSVAAWTVVLDYSYSRQAEITSLAVTSGEPSSVVYQPQGVVDAAARTVYIDVVEKLIFPFTVAANITFSAKSEADLSGLSGNKIRFDRYQDSTMIRVTAEDEVTKKDWKVKLRYHFSEEANIMDFKITASQPSGVVLGSPVVQLSPAEHTVWVNVADWGGLTNLQISPDLKVSDKAVHNLNGDLLFVKKTSESKTINVMAESGKVTPWTVKLKYKENNAAEITGVRYTGHEPADINFIGATIDSKTATVVLELQTWNGHTEFSLKGISYTLSDKASASIPVEMTFRKQIQESLEYVVKAQDGTEKKWTFKLLYHESSAAEVTRFRITGSNRPGVISMATAGSIVDGVIEIDLYGGVRDAFFSGFQINVEVEASAKSTHDIPALLSFSKATDVRKYTVTAESGMKKEWSVRFANKASVESNILAIKNVGLRCSASGADGNLKVADWRLEGKKLFVNIVDEIYMNKYGSNWPSVDIDFNFELSAKAAVEGQLSRTVKVDAMQNSSVKVIADNGVNSTQYDVIFTYRPQLDNANLDAWRGNDPGGDANTSWCSANNSMATGTTSGTGKSGRAAVITTKTGVPIVNVAAGTLFLGRFKMDLGVATSDPRSMTHFGIPFPAVPKKIRFDAKYRLGSGTLKDGTTDKAQIWAEIDYWPVPNKVATDANYNAQKDANVKKYAFGEIIIDRNVDNWTTYTIELVVTNPGVTPTNLLFVAASSKNGDSFDGCNGSQLMIDNIELIYE